MNNNSINSPAGAIKANINGGVVKQIATGKNDFVRYSGRCIYCDWWCRVVMWQYSISDVGLAELWQVLFSR